MDRSNLGEKFKGLREEILNDKGKVCTQRELAKILEIPYSRICDIEKGNRPASITELKAYKSYFNAPYEYMLGETENRHYENMLIGKDLGLSDDAIRTLTEIKESCIMGNYDDCYKTLSDMIENADFIEALEMIHHLRVGSLDRKRGNEMTSEFLDDKYIYLGVRWKIEKLLNKVIDCILEPQI